MSALGLQRCTACGHVQYPPRACCESCLSDALYQDVRGAVEGALLARTVLHHSQEARFRPHLPLGVGLVKLDAGPIVLCFVPQPHAIGARVTVRASADADGRPVLMAG
jgi:uncharacterized OB-fold protein